MIDTNKIYNENCLDTIGKLPAECIDLVVTSPPYDDQRNYNGYEFNFEEIAKGLYRILKKNRIVVWIVGDKIENNFRKLTSINQLLFFKEIGFNIYDIMIYSKNSTPPVGKNKRYTNAFEYMFILSKGNPEITNIQKEKCKLIQINHMVSRRNKNGQLIQRRISSNEYKPIKNVWTIQTGFNHSSKDEEAFLHPAIFPEVLCERHILSWSNENDIIYDCFMGSGTTAKMCIVNNRRYIGSEISKEYCDIANKRILPYKQQTNLFYQSIA